MPRTRSIAWSRAEARHRRRRRASLLVTVLVVARRRRGRILVAALSAQDAVPRRAGPEARRRRPAERQGRRHRDGGGVRRRRRSTSRSSVTRTCGRSSRPSRSATIGSLSLLGESIIDIKAAPGGTPLPDWAYVHDRVELGTIDDLTTTAADSLEDASKLIADVRAGRGTLGKLVTDDALYTELQPVRRVGGRRDARRSIRARARSAGC